MSALTHIPTDNQVDLISATLLPISSSLGMPPHRTSTSSTPKSQLLSRASAPACKFPKSSIHKKSPRPTRPATRFQPSRVTKSATYGSQKAFQPLSNLIRKAIKAQMDYDPLRRRQGRQFIISRPKNSNLPGPTPRTKDGRQFALYDDIEKQHFRSLIDGSQAEVYACVVELYLQNICYHMNRTQGVHETGAKPLYYTQDSSFYEQFQKHEFVPARRGRVTKLPNGYTSAAQRLQNDGITSAVFKELHHFFIHVSWADPLDKDCVPIHSQLLIISPRTKTMLFFCSADEPEVFNREIVYAQGCMLIEHITRDDVAEPWFVPSEWRIRKDKGSPQGPTSNCTIHVMSNAMAVAFGHTTNFAGRDMDARRWRVAGEMLNGGFEPCPGDVESEYWYPSYARFLQAGSEGWHKHRSLENGFVSLVEDADIEDNVCNFDADLWYR